MVHYEASLHELTCMRLWPLVHQLTTTVPS